MQHGYADHAAAVPMLQAIGAGGATPIVRVPWNEPSIIGRMLDAGALGVIVPMVNSVEETQAAVAACRYFPAGARSYGPSRGSYAIGGDYFDRANGEIACIPMIETTRALDALEGILSVPGVDAVYVGPSDMSVTMGLPPSLDNGGPFEEARRRIARECNARGIVAGIHANASLAAKHAAAGYRMITITTDLTALNLAAAADLRTARGLTADGATAPPVAAP
jgi:4-hydroxy-2-oxoheptanedioate aldolase